MKILVVGNGFDLAHGIPTSYWDCLDFLEAAQRCITWENTWDRLKNTFPKESKALVVTLPFLERFFRTERGSANEERKTEYALLHTCIDGNLWLEHFLDCRKEKTKDHQKWIDFEAEISCVIQMLERTFKGAKEVSSYATRLDAYFFSAANLARDPHFKKIGTLLDHCIKDIFPLEPDEHAPKMVISSQVIPKIVDLLYDDLKMFTTAIELYLKICTGDGSKIRLQEIDQIGPIDKVLSFNYTDTFLKYMGENSSKPDNVCFIHGKLRENITDENSPLVIGIDEYLDENEQSKNVDLVMFKKYFQRLYKASDYQYTDWVNRYPRRVNTRMGASVEWTTEASQLYIFGHSLDVTDKDVLRTLILEKNRTTTIFYRNSTQLGNQIKNLIRVIGPEELNKRARSSPPTIRFKQQNKV